MSDSFSQSWQRAANQSNVSAQQSDQWLRKIDLTIYDNKQGTSLNLTPSSANGIDLPDIRVVFQVRRQMTESPNLLTTRIYNLSPQTMAKALAYKRVVLSAGYQQGRFGVIFDGAIAYFRRGKETPVDTYLEIVAGDGDSLLRSVSNTQYKAGYALKQVAEDQANLIVQQAGDQPLSKGVVDLGEGGNIKLLKQMMAVGMNSVVLRDVTNAAGADFWIDQGKINILDRHKYMPGETAVLSAATGLIGMPEVTSDGIQARCLLNPNIRLGGLINIKTELLSGVAYMPGQNATVDANGNVTAQNLPIVNDAATPLLRDDAVLFSFTSPTGTYKVLLLEHSGDSRGTPWYSDMVCLAVDAPHFEDVLTRAHPEASAGIRIDTKDSNLQQGGALQPAQSSSE